ncbi:MAG: type II methionyl aminopeptidase [Nanoarchaeota archaeon]
MIEELKKAGRIASDALNFGKTLCKEDADVKEIIERIENKIELLKGKPAFPTQLAINEVAAHFLPDNQLKLKAGDLVKLDIGVHINGFIADTAATIEIKTKNFSNMIKAAEEALDNTIKLIKPGIKIFEIGAVIEETIKKYNLNPIKNLSGHSIEQYNTHAGITIPNYNNKNEEELKDGTLIAIEPFATSGIGFVEESKPSGIYSIIERKPVRDKNTRLILDFIENEFKTLPFSKYWLINKFGQFKTEFALGQLEREKILYSYPRLVERSKGIVSQTEHTIYISDKPVIITKID